LAENIISRPILTGHQWSVTSMLYIHFFTSI